MKRTWTGPGSESEDPEANRKTELSVVYTTPIMLFFSIALLYFVKTDWRISRTQGVFAALGYATFLTAAFFQGWG